MVVTDPANAQFLVYRQAGKAGLGRARPSPAWSAARRSRWPTSTATARPRSIVLSEQEKQIGRSVLADGRLDVPRPPCPSAASPWRWTWPTSTATRTPEVLYVARTQAERSDDCSRSAALKREKSGTFVPFRWGQEDDVPLQGARRRPAGDPGARRQPRRPGRRPGLQRLRPAAAPARPGRRAPRAGRRGPRAARRRHARRPEPDGPGRARALIVAQNTFARNLLLDKAGHWEVKDQYNSGRGSAQVQGAAALDTDGDGTKEIVLLDRTSKSLLFLDLKDGVYRPGGSLSVGPIDFQGMHVADLDGDGRDDLLMAGTDRFGVVLTGRKGQRLKPLASYESTRNEARLGRPRRRRPQRRRPARHRPDRHRRALRRDRHLRRPGRPEPRPGVQGLRAQVASATSTTWSSPATWPSATSTATAATTSS